MEFIRNKLFTGWIFAGVLALGLNACNSGVHLTDPDAVNPAGQVQNEKLTPQQTQVEGKNDVETGCASGELLQDPLCKFVAVKSESFMVFNGQNLKVFAFNDFDSKGNTIGTRYSLPATPTQYFAAVSYSFSALDGLKHAEEWMLDFNHDGKFDNRITTVFEFEAGKIKKESITTVDLNQKKDLFFSYKIYDYSESGKVKWKGGKSNYVAAIWIGVEQVEEIDAQGLVTKRLHVEEDMAKKLPTQRLVEAFEYNEQKQLLNSTTIKIEQSVVSGLTKVLQNQKVENTYDENQRLALSETLTTIPLQSWKYRNIDSRSYDEQGRLAYLKQDLDNGDDGQVDLSYEWTHQYDEFGNNTVTTWTYQNAIAEVKNDYRRLYQALEVEEPQVASVE